MARKPADQSVHKDDIIIAAADVLRQHGYEATTMKDIAARVNLTAASLYHHFKSKDSLVLAVLELGLSHAIQQIEAVVNTDQACAEKLRRMIRLHVIGVTENTPVSAAMVFEIRSLLDARIPTRSDDSTDLTAFMERRDRFFQQRDQFERLFRQVVQQGIDDGEFRQVDAAIVTRAMLGAHNWVGVWYKPSGRLTGEEIAEQMADTFIHSLKMC